MFVIESKPLAILFCVITMLCWGSWANTQKLVGRQWRFELFYWDYVFGMLLMAIIFAFTMGSFGSGGRPFVEDLRQASWTNIGSAVAGGALFNLANILLVAGIAVAGMAVAFPVGIGTALVLGAIVNYLAEPKGNAVFLFTGVALVTAAIVLDAVAYRRIPGQSPRGVFRGLIIAILCGLLMGFFYRFVAAAMPESKPESFLNMPPGKLSPYTAMVCFALGVLASQVAFNVSKIVSWATTEPPPPVEYFQGTLSDHFWGILGGMIWAVGMTFNIIAMGVAGPATAYALGQGATMVAAAWGVFIWREFREAAPGTGWILAIMFVAYLAGLALVAAAMA